MVKRVLPRSQRQYVKNRATVRIAATLQGARAGAFPKFVAPSLATLRDRPPSGGNWVHEIKFDGYRLQAHLREGIEATTGRRASRACRRRSGTCRQTAR
jgi:ATP-dependent DNA ligase